MDDVLTVLRQQLEIARADGEDFDSAWPAACEQALARSLNSTDRQSWSTALWHTRDAWVDAFEGGPERAPALASLRSALAHL